MRAVGITLLFTLTACGASGAPPPTPVATGAEPDAERWDAEGDPIEAPTDGTCGGLGALALEADRPLLGDRVHLRLALDAATGPMSHDIMSAPASAQRQEVAWLRSEGARMGILVEELFRAADDGLERHLERVAPEGSTVAALEGRDGTRIMVLAPSPLRDDDGDVRLLDAYLVDADGLVLRMLFVTSPEVAATGGCGALARRIAASAVMGARRVDLSGGTELLEGTLAIQLVPRHVLVVDEGPDFSVYRVLPIVPFASSGGSLGIYSGRHPSFDPPGGATTRTTEMLGREVTWHDSEQDGARQSEALVETSDGVLHVFYGATEPQVLDALRGMAESLHEVAPSARAPVCQEGAHATLPVVPPVDSQDFAVLARATRFATAAAALGEPDVAEVAAFRRLLAAPDRGAAFLALATGATTAGRLYGLAGLRLVDRASFDRVLCAVRASLDREVTVLNACGASTRITWELVERTGPDAIRGEDRWGEREWSGALARGEHDIVGGAIGRVLASGDPRDRELEGAMWLAGAAGTAGLAPTAPVAPARARALRGPRPRLIERAYGGFCAVKRDGRVSCWGSSFSETRVQDLPDLVRHPLDVETGVFGCVLDASRQRTCWHEPGRQRHVIGERCGVTFAEGPIVQRRDDGPWRELVQLALMPCGIHEDGSLRCFASDRERIPEWAGVDSIGVGDAWRVPIEGRVVGASDGAALEAYAWTDDGRVYEIGTRAAPREIGRLEGIQRIVGDGQSAVFAELRDGRVLAWGARGHGERERAFWRQSGPRDEQWIEVTALRGARIEISDYHGCARLPDGRVLCWGSNRDGEIGPGDPYHEQPREVAALRGARELYLQPQVTCGLVGADTLRCLGLRVPDLSIEPIDPDERGPHDITLPR